MAHVSNLVIDLIEASGGGSAGEVGRRFLEALRPFGATAINARAYPSAADGTAEQVFVRLAPPAFMPVYDEPRFFRDNPLPAAARAAIRPFTWSDATCQGGGAAWVWDAMRSCGCPDGIAIPCHGPGSYLGLVSVAFTDLGGIAPGERLSIELAAHVLHGRMHGLSRPRAPTLPALTIREADCLRFVADGRTNAQIAAAMGVSRATVATHLANARGKLGARTRAQAVAAMLAAAIR